MPYILKLDLPGLPQTINSIGQKHWALKYREARYWKQFIASSTLGKRPPQPLPKARLILTRFSSRPCDSDNLVASFKHCIDGLITAKILLNDRYENIGMPEYKWEKTERRMGRIRIEVYETT